MINNSPKLRTWGFAYRLICHLGPWCLYLALFDVGDPQHVYLLHSFNVTWITLGLRLFFILFQINKNSRDHWTVISRRLKDKTVTNTIQHILRTSTYCDTQYSWSFFWPLWYHRSPCVSSETVVPSFNRSWSGRPLDGWISSKESHIGCLCLSHYLHFLY